MGVGPLPPTAASALVDLLHAMRSEPQNLTAITDLLEAVDRHLADSLAALALPEVATAAACVDVGSGGGFPGLPLAVARPDMEVTLVESERRKAEWLRRASDGLANVRVVADRSEHLATASRERWPLATARALAPPPVTLELAAPLVRVGGTVVLWRGDDPAPDADARSAAALLGLEPRCPVPVTPFPGARRRLQAFVKVSPTPARFPRRPGRAVKRPLPSGR